MTFVSLPFFLFIFVTTAVYYTVPKKFQWVILLLASCVFYWSNSRWLILILFCASMITFAAGLGIQRVTDRGQAFLQENKGSLSKAEKKEKKEEIKKTSRRIMLTGVVLVLGMLLVLKYANFFGDNLNSLLSLFKMPGSVPHFSLLLPLGISFYTLQAISYIMDVYRGKCRADTNPAKFFLYLSFFPQIVQGPIARHGQLANQLYAEHSFDYRKFCFGIQLMLWGLTKKLIISERLALPANAVFDHYKNYSGPIIFFAVALYGLQVYTDFSGGMDIARGVAQMLGIELELNFAQPYFSSSVEDFWRRWHMTMGRWMRDYVFYPLSLSKAFTNLSRKSRKYFGQYVGKRVPSFLAMFVVYFLVGFWHGPDWKYVVFGLWNGVFIMSGILLENAYRSLREKCGIPENAFSWRAFRMIRTFFIVSFGRYFSRANGLRATAAMLVRTFHNWRDLTFITNGKLLTLGLDNANWILLMFFVVLLFYVDLKHEQGISFREVIARQPLVFRWILYISAVLGLLVFGCYGPAYDAASFIYQQF